MSLKDFFNRNSNKNGSGPASGGFEPDGSKPDGAKIASTAGSVLIPAVLILLLVRALAGSFYTLSETESAVVTTLGQATVNNNKGLQFKIPFIQEVT